MIEEEGGWAGWGAEKAAVGAERDARGAGSCAVKAPGGKGAIRRKLKLATNCGATCCYDASLKKPLLQIRLQLYQTSFGS